MNKLLLFVLFFSWESCLHAEKARQEFKEIKQQKTDLFKEQERLVEEASKLEKMLQFLFAENEKKKANISKCQEEIAKKLPLLARLGRVNPLSILAKPSTSQDTFRGLVLARTFTSSVKNEMQRLQTELHEIAVQTKELEEKTQSHTKLLQNVEFQQAQLSTLADQKIEDVKQEELNRLADEEDVNTILDESRSSLSKKRRKARDAAAAMNLPFRWLEPPVVGKVVQDLALQKKFSPNGIGMIFETKKNAEVFAPSRGTVVFKGPFRSQGDILIIDHGDKVYTILMGMHKIDAEVKDNVYAGKKIGMMAGYGAKSPKLYLELRREGKAIDPNPYFAN